MGVPPVEIFTAWANVSFPLSDAAHASRASIDGKWTSEIPFEAPSRSRLAETDGVASGDHALTTHGRPPSNAEERLQSDFQAPQRFHTL